MAGGRAHWPWQRRAHAVAAMAATSSCASSARRQPAAELAGPGSGERTRWRPWPRAAAARARARRPAAELAGPGSGGRTPWRPWPQAAVARGRAQRWPAAELASPGLAAEGARGGVDGREQQMRELGRGGGAHDVEARRGRGGRWCGSRWRGRAPALEDRRMSPGAEVDAGREERSGSLIAFSEK